MNRIGVKKLLLPAMLLSFSLSGFSQGPEKGNGRTSEWVYPDQGKLQYKTLPEGDRIMDFSYAGYMGGGVAIPVPEVKVRLSPREGDNTEAIQAAVDQVSAMPLVNGFRGAVLLEKGLYECARPILLNASGVVLRGSGPEEKGTVIRMTGDPHVCLAVKADVKVENTGIASVFADDYVPSGAMSFTLKDASGFAVGDVISISRPVTEAWVRFMGMDQLVRNGKKQTWITGEVVAERRIKEITKNKIILDVPLTDSYDARYLGKEGVKVTRLNVKGMLSQIGFENLRIVSPEQSGTITEGHHKALSMSGLTDGWARNIEVFNTVNSVSITGKRITVEGLRIFHALATEGAAKPADINGSGQQLLFNKCSIQGNNMFFFGTGAKVTGPVVVLNCTFKGNGWIQPHQRWATGLLIDNCNVPEGGIDFMNRGAMGSGHGWSIGWAVAWNCQARSFLNQRPPGAANWVIGGQGRAERKAQPFDQAPLLAEGIYDSPGRQVAPQSLYLAQLLERLGTTALKNIGY